MTATLLQQRTIAFTLTDEPEPAFRYGQRLSLKQGTGRVTGMEHISAAAQNKLDEPEGATTETGWHYSFEFDAPHRLQDPIQWFSEVQLMAAIAQAI